MLIKQIRQTCTIGLHHHTTLPAELMTIKAKLHKNRDRKRERGRGRQKNNNNNNKMATSIGKSEEREKKNHPLWDENKETHFKEFNTITR